MTATDLTAATTLYDLAGALMRAPMDGRTTEQVLTNDVAGREIAVGLLAEQYGYAASGWAEDGRSAVSFLTRYVEGSLGRSQVDLAVAARDLADSL